MDTAQRLLFSGDQLVPLTPKEFDTLQALIEADGRIVEKEEFHKNIWPDSFIEEGSLARNISILRKVLGKVRTIKNIARPSQSGDIGSSCR